MNKNPENTNKDPYEVPDALTKLLKAYEASKVLEFTEGGEDSNSERGSADKLEVCPTDQGITFFSAFPTANLEDGKVLEIKSPRGYPYRLSVAITREGEIFKLKGLKKGKGINEEFDFDFNPREDDENFAQALDAEISEEAAARKERRAEVKGVFTKNRTQYPIFVQIQRGGESIYIAHTFQYPVKAAPEAAGQEKKPKR